MRRDPPSIAAYGWTAVAAALALTGLVTPAQAFAGFSNPAVITVWAMFILSEGLTRTGIANVLGRYVMRMAGTIALSHHERWDGGGYPKGLEKDDIPLTGRIMAVADVYDALRSDRCYKRAFSHEYSSKVITEKSGSHFDPEVVNAFVDLEDEFNENLDR